jgi:formate dehydrogenase major subunit
VRPAVRPPGEARPDWEVIRDVAIALCDSGEGRADGWRYEEPAEVWDEIARVVPQLFGGIAYDRLTPDGLQWPCPTRDHPGTRTVHGDSFVRGRALLTSVDYTPPQDALDAKHPFILITGRILDHYNVGTMTRRTPSSQIVKKDYLELHPEDAARLKISDGASVKVRSRWGEAIAPAKITRRIMPGTSFLTFHYPETNTNCVVGPYTDPKSKCPDYKVVAVELTPA